jgi:hypothetical protein
LKNGRAEHKTEGKGTGAGRNQAWSSSLTRKSNSKGDFALAH